MPLASLVLTAAPGSAHLTDAMLSAVRGALADQAAVGPGRWLSPAEAWEADIEADASSLAALREAASAAVGPAAVDVNVVPAGTARGKRILSADMESTIIAQELVDEIAGLAGRREEVQRITEAAMRGELDFGSALVRRVALFEGLEVTHLAGLLERVSLMPGAQTLVRTMAALGARSALVTGGFTIFAEPIARRLGFDAVFANVLEIAGGRLTGRVGMPILDAEGKAAALRSFARESGAALSDTLAVGDGANDVAMLQTAGLGVAFRPKPVLAKAARALPSGAVIAHGDLTALLSLQGIAQEALRR